MANTYLPVGLSLKGRHCLVVGGGEVAVRKIEILLDYDCSITVVAPSAAEKVEYFAGSGRLKLEKREYASPEAGGYGLVVSASDSREVNAAVAADCSATGVPVNVVDDPKLCSFTFPAIVRRDNLTVAVSTDGKAPFLAAHLRAVLEDVFPERWAKIAAAAAVFRRKARERWPKDRERQMECYERFVGADWKEILKENRTDEDLNAELDHMLDPGNKEV